MIVKLDIRKVAVMKLFQLNVVGLFFVVLSLLFGQAVVATEPLAQTRGVVLGGGKSVEIKKEQARSSDNSPGSGLGDGADKNVALNLLVKGLEHCTKATRSTRTDQVEAKQEYEAYVTALSRAKAIYPKIRSHSRTLSRQIEQCSQIGTDIARTQALPLLEKGVLACKEAKVLAKGDYLTKAKVKYSEYLELRNQAVALTESVLKVASNSSKVRRCDKLENNLMVAHSRVVNDEQKAEELISLLRRAEDSCLVAQRIATKAGKSRAELNSTVSMLGHAERYFKETEVHAGALARAANYPGYETSKQIKRLTSTFSICRDELVVIVDAATKSVVRQEELAKILEQQKLEKTVAIAVAKAKKEALAAFTEQAQLAKSLERDKREASQAVDKISRLQDKSLDIVAEASNLPKAILPQKAKIKGEKVEKEPVVRVRSGKSNRSRSDVVQVTESW